MASSDGTSLAMTCWPDMTVALPNLASPDPVSGWVGRAIEIFSYVFIRENSDCCAARANDVRMLANFAQVDNLPLGRKLSPVLTKKRKLYFAYHPSGASNGIKYYICSVITCFVMASFWMSTLLIVKLHLNDILVKNQKSEHALGFMMLSTK